MKKLILIVTAFLGLSAGSASATCTGPAVMHDFPGTAFNMSLGTAPDGNCGSNILITTWGGVTLGAASNYGTSPGAVVVPGVNAFITNTPAFNQTQLNSVALGSPSNYGTSPGAVAVQGVNAFVTNTVPVTGTFWQATQPVSGTFWQATQPVSAASGALVNGASVAQGSTTDTPCTLPASGTACSQVAIEKAAANAANTTATNSALPVPVNVNGTATAQTGLTPGVAQTGTKIAADVNQASIGGTAVVADPCQSNVKLNASFSQTTSGTVITGTSGKKNYICSVALVASAAANASLVEYSGTCTGGTAFADFGSTTAANGPAFPANGGLSFGSGQATVISGGGNSNTGYNVCLLQNGSATLSGSLTYVQQ